MNRKKPPLISPDEITDAINSGNEVIGFAAQNDERRLFVRLDGRNGSTAPVWFDLLRAHDLLRHLEMVFYGAETSPAGGSQLKAKSSVSASYGSTS